MMSKWRPAKVRCLAVFLGRRCSVLKDETCLCERYGVGVLDHVSCWKDEQNRLVYTSEPYSVHGEALAEFLSDVEKLGGEVSISGASQWNPGRTFLIEIRKRARGE